jgi:catechol 2,3-dioxygenase-like lactoylglutathione lyase family enzyme
MKPGPSRYEEGTKNYIGIYGLREALRIFRDLGMSEVAGRVAMLLRQFPGWSAVRESGLVPGVGGVDTGWPLPTIIVVCAANRSNRPAKAGRKPLIPRWRLQSVVPMPLVRFLRSLYFPILKVIFLRLGRPRRYSETSKARARRLRDGFFDAYCTGKGLDVGFGGDLLAPNCQPWDFEHGDGQHLTGLADGSFDFVYSSHTLEHIPDPEAALRNWWRVLKPGGFLLLYVPHRDLFEKKQTLPSRWNREHLRFFLPDRDEPPDTVGIRSLISRVLTNEEVIYVRECSEGHTVSDPDRHSDGEYSIEAVVHKRAT